MHFWKVQALTYLAGAWSYRWYAVGLAWILCLAGWGAVAALPDQYEAEAKVYIDTESLMTPLLKGIAVSPDSLQQIAMMLKTFISRPNLEQVVRISNPGANSLTPAQIDEEVTTLEERISVRSLGIRNYYSIAFADNNSRYAQSVTETLLSILMDSNIGDKRRDIEGARSFLDQQVQDYENRLREAEQRRADFKSANLDILGRGASSARLEAANVELNRARNELPVATARLDSLRTQLNTTPATVPSNDPILLSLGNRGLLQDGDRSQTLSSQVRLQQANEQLRQLLTKYTEHHPDVIALKKSIADLETQLSPTPAPDAPDEAPTVVSSPGVPNPVYVQLRAKLADEEINVAVQRQRLNAAVAELNDARTNTSQTIDIQTKYSELDRDYGSIERTYQELLKSREAARLSQAVDNQAQGFAFRVIEPPQRSLYPSTPNRPLLNSLVLLVGIAGGIAAAAFLSVMSGRIIVSDDLATELGVPLIGVVTKLRQIATPSRARLSAAALSASVALLPFCYIGVLAVVRTSVYSILGA